MIMCLWFIKIRIITLNLYNKNIYQNEQLFEEITHERNNSIKNILKKLANDFSNKTRPPKLNHEIENNSTPFKRKQTIHQTKHWILKYIQKLLWSKNSNPIRHKQRLPYK